MNIDSINFENICNKIIFDRENFNEKGKIYIQIFMDEINNRNIGNLKTGHFLDLFFNIKYIVEKYGIKTKKYFNKILISNTFNDKNFKVAFTLYETYINNIDDKLIVENLNVIGTKLYQKIKNTDFDYLNLFLNYFNIKEEKSLTEYYAKELSKEAFTLNKIVFFENNLMDKNSKLYKMILEDFFKIYRKEIEKYGLELITNKL